MLILSKTKTVEYFNKEVVECIKQRGCSLRLEDIYTVDKGVPILTNDSYKFSKCYSIFYVDENMLTLNVVFKNSVKDRINIKPNELIDYIGEDKIRDLFVYFGLK